MSVATNGKTFSVPELRDPVNTVVAQNVSKSFGSTKAFDNISIIGQAGAVHAITGENGAGKSTFMKILAGVEKPDAGRIFIHGQQVRFTSPHDALVHGVSSVFQEMTLLPNLTIAENIFLGREPMARGWLSRRTMVSRAREALDRVGVDVKPEWLARRLTIGEQQLVEIAKGICAEASIFFFDEPTAALNKKEVDRLVIIINELRAQGKTIFYISHRLEEIFRFCDMITVLKDGKHVATVPRETLTEDQLVTLMVGRPIQDLFPPRQTRFGAVALDVYSLVPQEGAHNVRFQLRRGEVLGLCGLEGQGQREILRSLVGVIRPQKSDITKISQDGKASRLVPEAGVVSCLNMGIGYIPEDRKTEGLYLDLSIYENVSLGRLCGLSLIRLAPGVIELVNEIMERLHLQARSMNQPVSSLSGGNQQKVMLGRWFAAGVDTLLVEQPTRGVDIGAKAEIYKQLREFTASGGAVLMISNEITEIIGLCDRIIVVRQGRLVGEVTGSAATEKLLMEFALKGTGSNDVRGAQS
jgi:ribose transport system ATP-binding protein